jgi:hypothetical protein
MKLVSALVTTLALVVSLPVPVLAAPEYSGPDFQSLYEYAVANSLPNLDLPNGRYSVTGNETVDDRIWEQALERGYVIRPTASGSLVSVDGVAMQASAAEAWRGLRSVARAAGMGFIVSSAYRSPSAQRTQFLSKLGGTSRSAIDAALTWYSIPGTSKHHSGYALDFRYARGTFGEFRNTPDYAWLAEGNFAIPKEFGLIPSYPDDVVAQGPNPEPWEFVWVGIDVVMCGLPVSLESPVDGPARAMVEAIGRCPGGMGSGEIPDWLES